MACHWVTENVLAWQDIDILIYVMKQLQCLFSAFQKHNWPYFFDAFKTYILGFILE